MKFIPAVKALFLRAKNGNFLNIGDDGSADVNVVNDDVQTPIPTNGDSLYVKDLDLSESSNNGFTGEITDYFDSLTTVNTDSGATDPKTITLWFNRTVYTSSFGFGCNDLAYTFSNVVIKLLGSGKVVRETIDYSADNTKYNSLVIEFEPSAMNGAIIEFHTADPVGLSNITSRKDTKVDAQLQAQKPDGTMAHIKASSSGNLQIQDAESGLAIAKGDVADTSFIHKFGDAPNFDVDDGFVTIWDGADTNVSASFDYVYSLTDNIDSFSSSDNGDTQTIEIQGLDADYNLIVQEIVLQGQATVVTLSPMIRVFRMKNISDTDIAGIVYCYINGATVVNGVPSVPADTRAIINDGNNQTLMAVFTIPAGFTGYMRDWYASASAAKRDAVHQLQLVSRPFGQVFQMKHKSSISITGTSYIQHKYEEPEVFLEKTDVEMHANTDQADAGVSAGFDIVLVKNP